MKAADVYDGVGRSKATLAIRLRAVEWTMLRYSAAGMQIRATASETSRFKVHVIKSLIKSKWCNGPIEAGTDKEGPW